MGKQKQKKGGSSSAAAAPTTPPCVCDHPFTCRCGHRPPRPSPGHKWDVATQQWGGKGHKQKGGSGQSASVGQQATTTDVGKTQIAQWQKLPSAILREYCQKQKRPPPKFKQLLLLCNDPSPPTTNKAKFKVRVIVPDPKNDSDKDLILTPKDAVENEEQAMEEAALLALLQLTPNLPHERKLPEPYKTTWLNTIGAQQNANVSNNNNNNNEKNVSNSTQEYSSAATSSTSSKPSGIASSSAGLSLGTTFTSAAERHRQAEQKRKDRNARIRKHEAIRTANRDAHVFLSARLRTQIQRLLQGGQQNDLSTDDDSEDQDAAVLDKFDSDVQCYVEERLHHEGFTKRQARTAFSRRGKNQIDHDDNDDNEQEWDLVYEECLQWLCVNLEDDQLPEGFDPRGQTLDGVTTNASGDAAKFGITIRDASWLLQQQQQQKGDKSIEDIFWDRICQIANVSLDQKEDTDDMEANLRTVQEEFEACEAMFPSECTMATDESSNISTITINMPEQLDIHFTFERGQYPSVYPTRILLSGRWEHLVGVAFHVELVKFLSTLSLGEPMLFHLYGQAQTMLQTLEDLPTLSLLSNTTPDLSSLVPKTIRDPQTSSLPAQSTTSSKLAEKKPVLIKKRLKARSVFWSSKPNQTTPATPFCWSKSIEQQRKSLPAWKARESFLSKLSEACQSGRVVLVTGDTGCGKTTQIPQFILEENPSTAKIVVAQPRRLAATGVAARVAEERGEMQPGTASVGYVVRGATAVSKDTRLLFCTFGILLRQLQAEGALESVTHVVIDEVHERNLDGDVLMGLLREALKSVLHLKVILMSATLDAARFAAYWGNAPTIHIPGRTYSVEDFMLEDVLRITGYNPPKKKRKQNNFTYRSIRKPTPWNDSEKSDEESEAEKEDTETPPAVFNRKPIELAERVKRVDQENVDYHLLGHLVNYIVRSNLMGSDGSILVFLQGVGEISEAMTIISNMTRDIPILLLPLHGGLQPQEQTKVFRKATGQVKCILSTNVAETSITIPDCTVVIDSCREKQSSYDPVNRMPLLVDHFASRASLKQRRGRAGRVRMGTCYKLISQDTFTKLDDHTLPEISRCALDQTLLSLLFLGVEDGSGRFLQKLLDPPAVESVNSAATSLEKLGALERVGNDELRLTPLGLHLAGIPAPPTIGKLLVMGSILGCRTGALAMAAGLSVGRLPFLRLDTKGEAKERNQLVLQERAKLFEKCGNSDHSMLAGAFMNWDNLPNGGGERKKYCESLGLSFNVMRDILQLVKQYDSSLSVSGFPPLKESDRNSQSWRVLRTCAVASMAPHQLVRVVRPAAKYDDTAEGARLKQGQAREYKFFIRVEDDPANSMNHGKPRDEQVFIHPSSSMFSVGTYSCPWLVFHSMVRTSKPFLRDATECSVYGLLLFGGDLRVETRNHTILVDSWVRLSANARIGALIQGLRSKMDDLLQRKIDNPSISIADAPEMQLIVKLLITDGLG